MIVDSMYLVTIAFFIYVEQVQYMYFSTRLRSILEINSNIHSVWKSNPLLHSSRFPEGTTPYTCLRAWS